MTLDELKFWSMVGFQIINALASSGLWLYLRYGDRNKQVDQKIEGVKDAINKGLTNARRENDLRADGLEQRLAKVEGQLANAPTHQDLAAIHEKLNETAGAMRELTGTVKGMNDTLKLMLAQVAQKGMNS